MGGVGFEWYLIPSRSKAKLKFYLSNPQLTGIKCTYLLLAVIFSTVPCRYLQVIFNCLYNKNFPNCKVEILGKRALIFADPFNNYIYGFD